MVAFKSLLASLGALWISLAQAAPGLLEERQSTDKMVFCHFMIGIVSDRTGPQDYDSDMQRAKAMGIDAFALNIGTDSYTDTQLDYAYRSAANNGMKVFISFDFNWYHAATDAAAVGQKIATYAKYPAQLKIGTKSFASSFAGDGFNSAAMRSAAGIEVFWAPNFTPNSDVNQVDAGFNWIAWDNNGNNKAPSGGNTVTVASGDARYQSWLNGKPYMAPVSPWFFTHFGPEVPYSKNWVFPGDLLWFRRWNEILALKPRFLEIITWNDYGESHYVGPLSSKHYDDGGSKWVNDMPHNGWLEMAKPFISAYKAGASSVNQYITSDQLVYWYRPTVRGANCDSTDTTMGPANNDSGNYFNGRPNGWETMADSVFVVSLLTSPGTITVTSGSNTKTFNAPAGANAFEVPMGVGQQKFTLKRGDTTVLSGTSLKNVLSTCVCGIYNFNAYVGTLPEGFSDPLGPDGLSNFAQGLKDGSCKPTPSLGTAAPPPTPGPTTTPQNPTTTTTAPPQGQSCVAGTVAPGMSGNYGGLCSFDCNYGYCPPGPCVCTSYGAPVPTPPVTGQKGCPAAGLDDSYKGLCEFSCNHGYCPPTACRTC